MWALLLVLMTQSGTTSSVTYFNDKAACDTQATFMAADMKRQAWLVHAYIHCMPVSEGTEG